MTARPKDGRDERVCVAQVGAAHGLRGEVRVFSFTEAPEDFRAYGPLLSEDGGRQFVIEAARAGKDHFVVKFRGVDDRDAAEMLRNMKMFVPRENLPPPDDDEYFHADLIGLPVIGRDGTAIGSLLAIHNFGAGDLMEIRLPGGRSVMLPFTQAVAPEVDLKAGRIVIDPPAGALDETPPERDAE
jgi:16S rRNA processing protein RimM